MDNTWKIIFKGEILPGFDFKTVADNFVRLLNLSDAQVSRLFSGKEITLKKELTFAKAQSYQSSFKKRGIKTYLVQEKKLETASAPFAGLSLEPVETTHAQNSEDSVPELSYTKKENQSADEFGGLSLTPVEEKKTEKNESHSFSQENSGGSSYTATAGHFSNQNAPNNTQSQKSTQNRSKDFNDNYYESPQQPVLDPTYTSPAFVSRPNWFDFRFEGRFGRVHYLTSIVIYRLSFFASLLFLLLYNEIFVLVIPAAIAWAYLSVRAIALRLHDLNFSAWFAIPVFLPDFLAILPMLIRKSYTGYFFFSILSLLIAAYLVFKSGSERENNFGPPSESEDIHPLLWFFIGLYILSIIRELFGAIVAF